MTYIYYIHHSAPSASAYGLRASRVRTLRDTVVSDSTTSSTTVTTSPGITTTSTTVAAPPDSTSGPSGTLPGTGPTPSNGAVLVAAAAVFIAGGGFALVARRRVAKANPTQGEHQSSAASVSLNRTKGCARPATQQRQTATYPPRQSPTSCTLSRPARRYSQLHNHASGARSTLSVD